MRGKTEAISGVTISIEFPSNWFANDTQRGWVSPTDLAAVQQPDTPEPCNAKSPRYR